MGDCETFDVKLPPLSNQHKISINLLSQILLQHFKSTITMTLMLLQ